MMDNTEPFVKTSKNSTRMSSKGVYFWLLSLAYSIHVISAHLQNDFRCSHKPPTQDNVQHVWLNDAHFDPNVNRTSNSGFTIVEDLPVRSSGKYRRQINPIGEQAESGSLAINTSMSATHRGLTNALVPMRIQVYYDDTVLLLEKRKRNLITEVVMPTVVNFFENVLSIRQDFTIDKFRIARRCPGNTIFYAKDSVGTFKPFCMGRCENYAICGEMKVPPGHLSACSYCNITTKRCTTDYSTEGKGVADTQILLYVSADQTARCRMDQTIAYAAHCSQDVKTDRPVAGHANLCPSSISTEPKDLKALIATVKHELTHVLGFSVSLFAYYRDQLGNPLTPRDSAPGPIPVDPLTGYAKWSDKVIRKVIRDDWVTGAGKTRKETHLMVTPSVVREVRRHFNCSTLEGAELEDQGSDGTSMTHWEKRLFENEAMTGTHTQNSVYSRLTLAALQDTGWYVANFSRADSLEWGKDLGCEFAQKSCKSWIDERRSRNLSIRPFCDKVKGDVLQISCTEDRASKAVCNIKQYRDPLPMSYRNFDYLHGVSEENLSYYGGSVDLADYCPFIQEFTWQSQNVTIRGSRCDLGGNSMEPEKNAALEHYGPQTMCLEHGKRWEQRSCIFKRHWHHFGAGCYRFTCQDGYFLVFVGNQSYPCYYKGQQVPILQIVDHWFYNGTIVCPACEKVCPSQKCKHHDRGVIDKFVDFMLRYASKLTDKQPESLLGSYLEINSNSIETDLDPHTLKSRESVYNQSSAYDGSRYFKHTDYLLQLFTNHQHPLNQHLTCSRGNNLHRDSSYDLGSLLLVLTMTLLMSKR